LPSSAAACRRAAVVRIFGSAVSTGSGAVVIVQRDPVWHGYGNLLTLTEPFTESDLILVYQRSPEADERAAVLYPGLPTFRYDPAKPGVLVEVGRAP
jgi:hypothetical protein